MTLMVPARDEGVELPVSSCVRPTWVQVDDGFYVGSTIGTFVGSVDRHTDGTFAARDARARLIGSFPTIDAAERAVAEAGSPDAA